MSFLFASVVQNLVELLQLPGLEEDRAFQKEIGLKTLVYKAYRYGLVRGPGAALLPPGGSRSLGNTPVPRKMGCWLPGYLALEHRTASPACLREGNLRLWLRASCVPCWFLERSGEPESACVKCLLPPLRSFLPVENRQGLEKVLAEPEWNLN